MTDSSTSNGSPIETAATDLIDDWKEHCKLPNKISSYTDLIERLDNQSANTAEKQKGLERALIHNRDWPNPENDADSPTPEDGSAWDQKQKSIAAQYVNGHQNKLSEDSRLFPNVPQPFMGDIKNPKVVVVTFNPGFHEFVDWVLGGPYKNEKTMWSAVEEGAKLKLQTFFLRMGYVVDGEVDLDAINAQCERAKRSWITEQDKILSAIRGGNHYPFVPWRKSAKKTDDITTCDFLLPSPLNLHGANVLPWVGGNWHCDYFAKSDDNPNHLRNYVRSGDEDDYSDGIAQVELFPYQSPKGSDVKKLAPEALKHLEKDPVPWTRPEDHLIPSQIPIFNYLVALLSQVRSENVSDASSRTLVIARGSAAKTAMFKQAVLRAGGEYATELKKCVYQLSGQNSSLTLKNLETLDGRKIIQAGKPSKEDYRKAAIALLGSNAVQTGSKES